MIRAIVIFLMLVMVGSCADPGKITNSWIGKTKTELYRKWGPPVRLSKSTDGGEIVIYSSSINGGQIIKPYLSPGGEINYYTPQSGANGKSRAFLFCINSKGIIYSGIWKDL
jgi:hypothetical protein